VVGGAIFRRVTIRSKPSSWMANYSNIKKTKSMQSHIATTIEGNWVSEKQEDIGSAVRRLEKLKREIKEGLDKDNMLKSKMIQDRCHSL